MAIASACETCQLPLMSDRKPGERRKAGEQVPEALLTAIVRYFDPLQVILFGSRARRDADPDSDWDLVVVLDDDAPPAKRTLRAGFEARAAFPFAADVIPIRRSRFAARARLPGTLSHEAAREGIVVYERGRPD